MALVYKVAVKKNGTDCKQLLFVDETGFYNSNNTGGYGGINLEVFNVTTSEVVITLPDNTTTTVDLFSAPYNYPLLTFPTVYYINGTSFDDGVYKFEFTITGGESEEYTHTAYYLSTCNLDCCMTKFAAKINPSCSCNDKLLQKWADMQSYYDAMWYNFECGNYNEVTNLLNKLTAMCSKNGCGCGC
jgi:hypothetical protein